MPERDLQMMMLYASRHHMPVRRLQLQLGLVAKISANSQDRSLAPFLFDYVPARHDEAANDAAAGAEQIAAAGSGNVRVIGRKLKGRR